MRLAGNYEAEATSPPPPNAEASRSLLIGYGCAALGATLFSTNAIFIKLAYAEGISTETLLAQRWGAPRTC